MDRVALASQLRRHEGERDKPYQDSKGIWTVGVGRNMNNGLRPDEITLLLENDITEADGQCRKYPWYFFLDDARQNVVCNLMFNMGAATFAKFIRFHAAMRLQDWPAAIQELKGTPWQKQVDPVLGDAKGRADELLSQLSDGLVRH